MGARVAITPNAPKGDAGQLNPGFTTTNVGERQVPWNLGE